MYRITDVTDTYVDALVRDETGQVMFMSCYGRDTALREFMGRIQIGGKSSDGLSTLELHSIGQTGREIANLGDPRRLDKRMGKLPVNLYGRNVGHMFIYDKAVMQPDLAARQAWILSHRHLTPSEIDDVTWLVIEALSPVPLLPHWKHAVLPMVKQEGMVVNMAETTNNTMSRPLGKVQALKVRLADDFPKMVSQLIRQQLIGLQATALPAA